MSLYDSFKLSNSTQVPKFAGSVVPQLAEIKKNLEESYLKAKDMTYGLQEKLALAETNPLTQDAFDKTNKEVQDRLNEITKSGRFEEALPEIYDLASKTAVRLAHINNANTTRKKLHEELADPKLNLSPGVRDYFKESADQTNGALQFDEFNRANKFVAPTPVRELNNTEEIKKTVVDLLRTQGYDDVSTIDHLEVDPANPSTRLKVTTGTGVRYILKEDLKRAVDNAIAIRGDWNASLDQSAKAKAWHRTKAIPEEEYQQKMASGDPTTEGVRAAELMTSGKAKTAKEAYQMAIEEMSKDELVHDLKEYAALANTTVTSSQYSEGPSTGEEIDTRKKLMNEEKDRELDNAKKLKALADAPVVAPGLTAITPEDAEAAVSVNAEQQKQTEATVTGLLDASKRAMEAGDPMQSLAYAKEAEEAKIQQQWIQKKLDMAKKGLEKAYDNVAMQNRLPTLSDETKKAYTELGAKLGVTVLDMTVRSTPMSGFAVPMQKKEITLRYEKGGVKNSYTYEFIGDTKTDIGPLRYSKATKDALFTADNKIQGAKNRITPYLGTTKVSLQTTEKSMNDETKKQIASVSSAFPVRDISGSKEISQSDIDYSTVKPMSFVAELGAIKATATVGGKEGQMILLDVSKSNVIDKEGAVLIGSGVRELAELGHLVSDKRYAPTKDALMHNSDGVTVQNGLGHTIRVYKSPHSERFILYNESLGQEEIPTTTTANNSTKRKFGSTFLTLNEAAAYVLYESLR